MVVVSYGTPVIADSVIQVDASTWKYDFSVTNNAVAFRPSYVDKARLTDYLLPFFSDAALSAIQAPTDWAWRIDTDDRFNLGHGAQTLHWYSTSLSSGIAGGEYRGLDLGVAGVTLRGFSFTSDFGPVKAPFLAGFSTNPGFWIPGDPALPGSPGARAAGLNQPFYVPSVPEPTTVVLVMAGLMQIGVTRRVHRRLGSRA